MEASKEDFGMYIYNLIDFNDIEICEREKLSECSGVKSKDYLL